MSKTRNAAPGDGSPNYTKTADPKVVIGKFGAPITYDEFVQANKNGYAWNTFEDYADYVGGWARPIKDPVPLQPYYRVYASKDNIPTGDIELLRAKYSDEPKVQQILARNVAPKGEVAMFGVDDGDVIRALIAKEKVLASSSKDPNYGLATAVANAKGKQ